MRNLIYLSILVVLLINTVSSEIQGFSWSNCQGNLIFETTNVQISPNPPQSGRDIQFTVSGKVKSTITGGTSSIVIKLGGSTAYSDSKSVCSVNSCPISVGPTTLVYKVSPPSIYPGHYTGQFISKGTDGSQIACVNFVMDI
ncbi:hypothetical protein DLAC_07377 [Tieghemostelium lacteum]|uniref:MD-2-related lipid-recognition domain-containing protein n=1 Tax=Tieghemostelium lacteum TaxID=361077 RepID=A0A151ZCE1_TIELA|nr:hypothetical protein DLAC_07377 [Tieghemostelium lacteum]|eukprot:KYQ91608.1 hypothetical protein DLAC_07377 [Tieghemostelium lacteum]